MVLLITLQQRIDVSKETVELAAKSTTEAEDLYRTISDAEPRFSVYRYTHEFEGHEESPIAFIYTCPSGAKVRERMVYASSIASVIAYTNKDAGLTVNKRVS